MKPFEATKYGITGGHSTELPHSTLEAKWIQQVYLGLDLFFVFFGSWTLFCWILVLLGGSFNLLVQLAWIPLLATAVFAIALGRKNVSRPQFHIETPSLKALLVAALAALAIVCAYQWSGSYLVFWLFSIVFLCVAQYTTSRQNASVWMGGPQRESWAALMCLCVLAVIITLTTHRPDADDSFYVNLIVTALDRPYEALLSHDGMYGEAGLKLFNDWYQMKSYEPLVAAVSRLTGADPLTLYYLIFPALTAMLAVFVTWSALRTMGGAMAAVGTAVVIIVIATWGDIHTSFGNFGFVRLYQGKAVMLTVCVPASVLYSVYFVRNPNLRNWLMLCFCQVTALGLSGSAILAVPTTVTAVLIGWYMSDRRLTAGLVWGIGTLLVVGGFFAIFMADSRKALGAGFSSVELLQWIKGTEHGFAKSLGGGPRAGIALFALLLAPLIAPRATQRGLIFYVLALLILIVNPLLSGLIGGLSERGTWRLFWSVPFPLMLGLLGQRLAAMSFGRSRLAGFTLLTLLVIAFISVPGRWTFSPDNRTHIGLPKLKVPMQHVLAGAIVRLTTQQDLILAPYDISTWITTYRHHPRLVGVRPFYGRPLRTLPLTERKARTKLMKMVSHSSNWSADRILEATQAIPQLGIDVIVMSAKLHAPILAQNLIRFGCSELVSDDQDLATLHTAGYQLWRCTSHGQL